MSYLLVFFFALIVPNLIAFFSSKNSLMKLGGRTVRGFLLTAIAYAPCFQVTVMQIILP